MEGKKPSYFTLDKKKGHNDSVISIDVLDSNSNILLTCSDDKSIRLWDLRINSSIKRYTDPLFKENNLSNAKFSPNFDKIYVGCGKSLVEFDPKTEKILINEAINKIEKTTDEINFVTVSNDGKYLATCDDAGEIGIYHTDKLETRSIFSNVHKNIAFTVDFINPSNKGVPYCISSGFDCQLIFWNVEQNNISKIININEICAKNIEGQLVSPPLVYNVAALKSTILVSVETGHIIGLNFKEPKKT